ncbi:iron-siderophore ABC transporter substrate-binding protein [Microbacterium marmarense]|uniref:Iron-siderophore ABC transporter substrate-binding protein n=1 Tax=Microbacterium marmarense TaxID=3122051 RepID=A0ABU8LUM9_9MICO
MPRNRSAVTAIAVTAAATLLLTACASPSTTADSASAASVSSDATFPVTVEHVYGETVIPSQPERVATVAWANQEVPLALGVVPVGMAKVTWGDDDDNGILPWVEDALADLDAETPVLFDETDGIDFEAVADTAPDVILAAYSGLTQEEYDTLSKIAPVVAYPDFAWGTTYQDMIRMNSAALGLSEQGDALIDELQIEVETALAGYPELAESTVMFSYINPADLSEIGFYSSHDTRASFLTDLGLPSPTAVDQESALSDQFFMTVSAEQAERFDDVDVFVTYGEADGAIVDAIQADPLLSQIPSVAAGQIAVLENGTPLAASANPSPLSISWGIDDYFALLAGALTPEG